MPEIYRYDEQSIYTGESREIGVKDGAPLGWTRTPPPEMPAGKFAHFSGSAGWQIIDERPPAPPMPVPERVSARRAKEALIRKGLYQAALDAIDAISDPTERLLTKNLFETSNVFERANPMMNQVLENALGMPQSQIDDLFRYAGNLP